MRPMSTWSARPVRNRGRRRKPPGGLHSHLLRLAASVLAATATCSIALAQDDVPMARAIADPLWASRYLALHLDWDEQLGGFDEGRRQTLTPRSHWDFETAAGGRWVW